MTLNLSDEDVADAVVEYLERRGYKALDRDDVLNQCSCVEDLEFEKIPKTATSPYR